MKWVEIWSNQTLLTPISQKNIYKPQAYKKSIYKGIKIFCKDYFEVRIHNVDQEDKHFWGLQVLMCG